MQYAAAADYSWSAAPGPMLLSAVLLAVYLPRWWRVRRELGGGPHGAPLIRLLSWLAGVAFVVLALCTPLDTLAGQSFGMHMVQHLLLLDFAAIFLILGLTRVLMRPVAARFLDLERALGPLSHPAAGAAVYVGVMWIWHVPFVYNAASEYDSLHVLGHVAFLVAGLMYWWHFLGPIRSPHMSGFRPIFYMVSTKLLAGILGVVLTFSTVPLYAFYDRSDPILGLTPQADQAWGGALMGLEQSVVMGVALVFLFFGALAQSERAQQREERYEIQ